MTTESKEQLLERFRAYLDETELETVATDSADEPSHTDLFSLFIELSALKNEIKLESRQLKKALDEFKAVFDTLQTSHQQLGQELEHLRNTQPEQRRDTLRPLLLELLELRDRFEAGVEAIAKHRGSALAWLCKPETTLITSMAEGQEISLRRLDQLLNSYQVIALETCGKPLDPHTMRAAAIAQRTRLANGIVVEELRKGYRWENELLRLAEVRVNKLEKSKHHE